MGVQTGVQIGQTHARPPQLGADDGLRSGISDERRRRRGRGARHVTVVGREGDGGESVLFWTFVLPLLTGFSGVRRRVGLSQILCWCRSLLCLFTALSSRRVGTSICSQINCGLKLLLALSLFDLRGHFNDGCLLLSFYSLAEFKTDQMSLLDR